MRGHYSILGFPNHVVSHVQGQGAGFFPVHIHQTGKPRCNIWMVVCAESVGQVKIDLGKVIAQR
jgi:hypothetical protein